MGQRVGLRDIAGALALDVSTVSRALSGDARVREETRERVRETARAMGYRPNVAARSLRGGATNRVAVLLSPPQRRFASPIFLELLATLEQRLREADKTLTVIAANTREEEPALVRALVEDRVADALVLGRTRVGDARVRYLLEQDFPFVTFGRTPWPDAHSWVDIDYRAAGRAAVAALAEDAPPSLHVISAPEGLYFADRYLAGAREAAAAHGIATLREHRAEITEAAGEALGGAILDAEHAPPAIACIQDSLAFGVYRAAAARGLLVGRDLTLFGGQDFPGSAHAAPPLSTFSTDDARVAGLITDVVMRRLSGADAFETHIIDPTPLMRASHRRRE